MYTKRRIYNNRTSNKQSHNMDIQTRKPDNVQSRGSELIAMTRDELLDLLTEMIAKNANTGDQQPATQGQPRQSVVVQQTHLNRQQTEIPEKPTVVRQESARPTTRSDNPDFRQLVQTTYRHVQISHALVNWNSIPKGVERAVDKLSKSIRPPRSTEILRERLQTAADDFKSRIVACVQEHLASTLEQNITALQALNQQDVSLAQSIVRRQVRRTLGRRIRETTIEEALIVAAATRASRRGPENGREPDTDHSGEPWSTARGRRFSASNHKNSAELTDRSTMAEIASTGRFEPLISLDDQDASQPMFDDAEFPPIVSNAKRRRNRSDDSTSDGCTPKRADVAATPPAVNNAAGRTTKSPTSLTTVTVIADTPPDDVEPCDITDDDGIETTPAVHQQQRVGTAQSPHKKAEKRAPTPTGNKTDAIHRNHAPEGSRTRSNSLPLRRAADRDCAWVGGQVLMGRDVWNELRRTPSHTVVVADSNGRNWMSTPAGWTTLSRSGGRLEDVTQLFKSKTIIADNVKSVMIAVGVNNATEDPGTITTKLTALHTAAAAHHKSRVFFVEVPIHPNSSREQIQGIEHINKTARDLFTAQFFIGMSVDLIVTASSGNHRDAVHYDRSTADQISAQVQQFLHALN